MASPTTSIGVIYDEPVAATCAAAAVAAAPLVDAGLYGPLALGELVDGEPDVVELAPGEVEE